MPQFLRENKQITKSLPSESVVLKDIGYKGGGKGKEKHKHLKFFRYEKYTGGKTFTARNVDSMHMRKTAILKLKPKALESYSI